MEPSKSNCFGSHVLVHIIYHYCIFADFVCEMYILKENITAYCTMTLGGLMRKKGDTHGRPSFICEFYIATVTLKTFCVGAHRRFTNYMIP